MPELPDLVVYIEALTQRAAGRRLDRLRIVRPFVLRTVDPPAVSLAGRRLSEVRRIGKRLVLGFEESGDNAASPCRERELFAALHLMIAGRLRWRDKVAGAGGGERPPDAHTLDRTRPAMASVQAAFEFEDGTLYVTEAGSTRRASIQILRAADLGALDQGGVEPLDASLDAFRGALLRERHTLKRALTDPRLFSGIGRAYSDEILHAARLSPLKLTSALTHAEVAALREATRATLALWIARLRAQARGRFPEKVTAFRPEMAVHGRFGQACPVCARPVQRIVYRDTECNYCAVCQTGGRLLADRALSRLLGEDWPGSLDDLP